MNRRVLLLIVGSLLLPLGCGDTIGPAYATLVVTRASLPSGVTSTAYSATLAAVGGDSNYTWSVTVGSLPVDLSLDAATGEITGTPSVVGSNTFTVQVASGDGQTATRQLTITVSAPPVLEPSELCRKYPIYPDYAIVTFEDAKLEAAIRAAHSVGAQEDLTCGLVSGVTGLTANTASITSLVGIQNLTSLTSLSLQDNSISDISVLSGLTSLTTLGLRRNSISDISPLSGLTSLTTLGLQDNSITDISALSGLTSLTTLQLYANSITDISALSGLTSLTRLYTHENSITDISALSGLTSLTTLHLNHNSITDISALSGLTSLTLLHLYLNPNLMDIQPLLDNSGLGAGDYVYLLATNVSCTDVAALQAKGVWVGSDCS